MPSVVIPYQQIHAQLLGNILGLSHFFGACGGACQWMKPLLKQCFSHLRTFQVVCGDFNTDLSQDIPLTEMLAEYGLPGSQNNVLSWRCGLISMGRLRKNHGAPHSFSFER